MSQRKVFVHGHFLNVQDPLFPMKIIAIMQQLQHPNASNPDRKTQSNSSSSIVMSVLLLYFKRQQHLVVVFSLTQVHSTATPPPPLGSIVQCQGVTLLPLLITWWKTSGKGNGGSGMAAPTWLLLQGRILRAVKRICSTTTQPTPTSSRRKKPSAEELSDLNAVSN